MLARVRSGALRGIDALVVEVEVDVASGLPHTTTVGLPDGADRESTDRLRAAPRKAGFDSPEEAITLNLPAPRGGGVAGVRRPGVEGPHPRGAAQGGLRLSAEAHHREPRAGRRPQGG